MNSNGWDEDGSYIPQTSGPVLYPTTSLSSHDQERILIHAPPFVVPHDTINEHVTKSQEDFITKSEKPYTDNANGISVDNVGYNGNEGDQDYPEGGKQAWIIVFGSLTTMISCFGYMNSLGSFQAHLSKNELKDYSDGEIGWIFSIYICLSFLGGIFIGPLFDSHGPRWLLIPGAIGQVLAIELLSVCHTYWHFMLDFILHGLSTALLFTPAVAIIAHYFKRRRGYATGVACTGGSIGGIVFPLVMQSLIPKIGFPWTVRILGLISVFLLLNGILILKPRFYDKGPKKIVDVAAFKDPMFALTTLGVFILEIALFIPVSYITSYAIANGIKQSLAYQLLAILNVGSLLGRWLPGLLSDRIGRFNTMLITTAFCFIVTLGLWLPAKGNLGAIIAYVLLFGFGSGTGISLTPVCVSQICRIEDFGKRYGTCYFVVSFG